MVIKKQSGQFCDLEAEEKLDIIFNNATDGIFIHDNGCNVVDVNQTACDSLGYTKKELLSMGMSKINSPELAVQVPEIVKKIIKNGQLVFESTYVRKDGSLMPVEINARTIKYSGKPAIMCFVRDITDRKKVEDQYSALIETSSDNVLVMQDGLIKYVNSAACKLTGYTKKEVAQQPFLNYVSPAYKEIAWERYEKRLKGQNPPNNYKLEILAKGGHGIPVEVNASLGEYEGKPAVIAFMRDITERLASEKEIIEKNRQLTEAQKLARTGSYTLDVASGTWKSSEVLDEVFGIDKNYMRDIDGWANIMPQEEREAMLKYLKEDVLKKKKPFDKKYRIVRVSDSEVRWVHGLGHFGFDPRGRITTMFGTIQDITETRLAEEQEAAEKEIIKQSELKYRGLIENTPMCIKVFDKDGNLKFLNRGGREEHHVEEEDDLLKWDWLGTVKPEYVPEAKKVFEEAFKGKTGEIEFEHTEDSLAHPWCHGLISPILDEKGKVVSVLFYSTNITELKRNEIKAKESELMFKTLLNSLPLCIKWFDSKGKLISINIGGREEHYLMDKTDEEVQNWDYITCIEPAYHKLVKEKMVEALKGKPGMFLMEHTPGTSTSHWCSSELLPVLDINNKVKYVLFISRDVTAEKEEEKKKISHAKELEKMNQLMIGRENKMIELKEKIREMELRLQIKK